MIPKWLIIIVTGLQKIISGPAYISATYVWLASHVYIKYKEPALCLGI